MSNDFRESFEKTARERITDDIWPDHITEEQKEFVIQRVTQLLADKNQSIKEILEANPHTPEEPK